MSKRNRTKRRQRKIEILHDKWLELQRVAEVSHLKIWQCGNPGHWKVEALHGNHRVLNYWPLTGRVYVEGTAKGYLLTGGVAELVLLAGGRSGQRQAATGPSRASSGKPVDPCSSFILMVHA